VNTDNLKYYLVIFIIKYKVRIKKIKCEKRGKCAYTNRKKHDLGENKIPEGKGGAVRT